MVAGPDLLSEYEITDRTKAILARVVAEASRRGAASAEPEDVLRGILADGKGVACRALDQLGADRAALVPVASQIEPPNLPRPDPITADLLPLDLLRTASLEATALGHRYVGTEHLLLALAGARYPAVAERLAEHGVTLVAARAKIAQLLGRQLPAH